MTCCPDCKNEQKGVGVDLKSRITIQQVEFNGQVFIHLPAQPLRLLLQHNFTLHGATYYLESISCWVNRNHFTCLQYIHDGASGFRTGWYAYDGLEDYIANRELRKLSPNVTFLAETSPQHDWLNLHRIKPLIWDIRSPQHRHLLSSRFIVFTDSFNQFAPLGLLKLIQSSLLYQKPNSQPVHRFG